MIDVLRPVLLYEKGLGTFSDIICCCCWIHSFFFLDIWARTRSNYRRLFYKGNLYRDWWLNHQSMYKSIHVEDFLNVYIRFSSLSKLELYVLRRRIVCFFNEISLVDFPQSVYTINQQTKNPHWKSLVPKLQKNGRSLSHTSFCLLERCCPDMYTRYGSYKYLPWFVTQVTCDKSHKLHGDFYISQSTTCFLFYIYFFFVSTQMQLN